MYLSSQSSASGSKAPANAALDPDDEELPDASPLALQFTTIPYLNFAQAFSFIQTNPSILVEQTTDSLLLEGFNAEIAGEKDRARRCVEKGLLVQYCRKLGKDGVRLFFQRYVFHLTSRGSFFSGRRTSAIDPTGASSIILSLWPPLA